MASTRLVATAVALAVAAPAQAAPTDRDQTFGSGGQVALPAPIEYAQSLRVDAPGRILVLGYNAVARFNYDGTPDETWGDHGVVRGPDGGFLVDASEAGVLFSFYDPGGGFRLARLRPDGAPDGSFGEDGEVTVELPAEVPSSVLQGPAGEVVIESYDYSPVVRMLTRLLPSGELDEGFGERGSVRVPNIGDIYPPARLAFQRDGKLLAAASWGFARFLADGSLDPEFGNGGVVSTFAVPGDYFNSMHLMRDGRFVAVGRTLARYLPGGAIDPEFGVVDVRGMYARSSSVNSVGEVIIAGEECLADFSQCEPGTAVRRYRSDGAIDTAFGDCGVFTGAAPYNALIAFDHRRGILLAGRSNLVRLVGGPAPPEAVPRCAALAVRDHALEVPYGRTGRYRIRVRNTGAVAAHDTRIVVADRNAEGLIPRLQRRESDPGYCAIGVVRVECHVGTLRPGAVAEVVLEVAEDAPGAVVESTLEVRSRSREGDYADNAAFVRFQAVAATGRCANLVEGASGPDILRSGDEPTTLRAYAGADLVRAGGGADCLQGGPDGDELHAGPGADTVTGAGGDDWLFGGPGRDRLRAGRGDDRVLARDGRRDRVDCGRGADVVVADRRDRLARCERRRS